MATFRHTIAWTIEVDGRVKTYSYFYDVADVDNVKELSTHNKSNSEEIILDQEPAALFVVCHSDARPLVPTLENSAGPTTHSPFYLFDGDMLALHLSEDGGSFNQTTVDNTTALLAVDTVTVSGITETAINCDAVILLQPAS